MSLLATLGLKPRPPATGPAGLDPALQAAGPAAPAVDKNLAAFTAARAAVQKLVDGLAAHPQKSHITAQIASAGAKLGEADNHAAAKDYAKASKALAEAKAICAAAKKLADDWIVYARQRANAQALAMSFGSADFDWAAWANPILAAADTLANASPPQFAAAAKKLQDITKEGQPIVKKLITLVKARLATIEKSPKGVRAFALAEIDAGKAFIATAEKAYADGQWSLCRTNSISALRVLGPAVRMCERRGRYDAQRATTAAAIAKVRAAAALKDRADALDKRLAEADALAAHDSLKIEPGIALLQSVATQAGVWAGLAGTVAAHAKARAAADTELAALDAHAAAAKLATQREAIRKLLADAKTLAGTADAAPDPAATWNAVLTEVNRARADLAAAKKLADGLGPAAAAEAAAANPGDAAALKSALDKLRADGKLAAKAPHAALADAEFKRFDERASAATTALAAKDGASAAKGLADAAAALAAAKAIQAGHAQFVDALAGVEGQLKALKKSPRAAAIKPRIDPVEAAVADATAKDQAHDATAAMAALRRAQDALAAARAADAERDRHDDRAADLAKRIAKVKDASEKTALDALAADAKKHADALASGDAAKALDRIEVRLDKAQLEAVMKANPGDKQIAKIAAQMVGKGGAATVDKMIQDIPDGGDPKLLNALAEGRYGVKFTNEAPLPGGDPVKAMKVVCQMFSTIPQDIVKNPSIRGVSYSDAIGSAGGSHSYDDAKVRMLGRPGIQQQFGAVQQSMDPKTGAWVDQLPAAIDADCQPKDANPVEYLGFAAAHEVGHGVDDASGFMARNGHLDKYGGWTTYGASVQPIADAVGADPRFADFYKTPEQRQYVLDKLLNKPATAPAAAPGSAEDNARIAFDNWHSIATSKNVYRRQGDCDAIKIGDHVYHEAYARTWVRYLAAARSKALTGYQFRAPGEWFAELYAGYRSGKLKDTHPAMEWLKKL